MMNTSTGNKIQPQHLTRLAIVYLRQSSPGQVKHNTESRRLQYALADRASALGFARVQTIDCDLGLSATAGSRRPGFQQLLSAVAMGDVGIVFSRELSRLSRLPLRAWVNAARQLLAQLVAALSRVRQ
jgi:DNA invertase Pin-like site-specific DNA recombinase